MIQPLKWLPDGAATAWSGLGKALAEGLPVPNGFVVFQLTPEEDIRGAYEQLRIGEKTQFIAVRGSTHAVLNVIGADQLVHTVRRFRAEAPDSAVLVQRMIHAVWCGKAHWHRKNLRIKANEGMLLLDPDTYLVNSATGKCIQKKIEEKQRKMIRHVDGSSRTVEREGERPEMSAAQLKSVADLAVRAKASIGWAIDDNERIWLLGVD